jgi:sulfate adenylyltransferase subunit 1 (EFTu-like GTPase family)
MNNIADFLEVLAATDEVKSGNWEKMKGVLEKMERLQIPSVVWYSNPDGFYYTVDKGAVIQNIKDREYFPKVLAGKTVVGSLVVSKSTGQKSAVVAVPVMKDGTVVGVLGTSIFLEQLNEIIKGDMNLPEDVIFFVMDPNAVTVLNWKAERIFQEPTKMGSSSLTTAIENMLARKEGMEKYEFDGKLKKVIYKTSPLTGWCYALGIEK